MLDVLKKFLEKKKTTVRKAAVTLCFLAAAFLFGRLTGATLQENAQSADAPQLMETSAQGAFGGAASAGATELTDSAMNRFETWGLLFTENWGLGFSSPGNCPTGNATADELKKYHAYYVGDTSEKKIYLTIDCGYENGNTEKILDALKKHQVSATFFVVGHYLESAPDLVKRMVDEGHTVGNHTYHHPDMSQISDRAAFQKEMDDVRTLYQQVTGQEMSMYYRPPQGKYSAANLELARDLGYSTFFWSLAYVDWNTDKQPTHAEAFDKLTKRIHPGAIVLLHNTSKTNGEILDELLTKWEEMGYRFATLDELTGG